MHDVQIRGTDASLKIRMLSLEDINLQAVRFISSDAFERMLSDSHKNAMIQSEEYHSSPHTNGILPIIYSEVL